MAKVEIYSEKKCNRAASHHVKTKRAIKHRADVIERKAERLLSNARNRTEHEKYFGPEGLTSVGQEEAGHIDRFVYLEAPNAMAIEFGHKPSGVFKGTKTKSPEGLYIITRAGLG